MAKKKLSFEFVTEQADSDRGMSNGNRVMFHYFNPKGLYAEKRALDEKIALLVDSGVVKSGWHTAYGSFNDFHTEQLRKLVSRRKGLGNIETQVTVEGLRKEIESIRRRIAEVEKGGEQ